jgi:hypothetical protein
MIIWFDVNDYTYDVNDNIHDEKDETLCTVV